MFTVQEIKSMAETFAGNTVTITNQKAVDCIKLAILIIADRSGYDFEIPAADYVGNVWITDVLPENNLGVSEVNIDDGNNTIYNDYQVRGIDILFRDSNRYIVHYKKLPTEPTNVNSTIEVHPIYKEALWEFMVGYARLSKWEGSDDFGMQLTMDFRSRVAEKWKILNRYTGPKQMVVQRHA